MSWAAIIAIVIEVLKQRAEAGWPLLKLLLERFSNRVLEDADNDTDVITVGAAPQELKDQIVAWLEKQKAESGVGMKFVYTILIRAVPLVADQIWDSFFKSGHVGKPLSEFTPAIVGASSESEDEILVDLI